MVPILATDNERTGARVATDCKGPALKHYLSVLKVDDLVVAMACGDDVEHEKA